MVDEDTDGGDGEATVQSLDTIGLEGLHVDINETIELTLSTLALGIVSQPGPGVVKGVDEHEGESSSKSTAGNVGGEFPALAGVLGDGEDSLDGVFEGEVEGLGGEVTEDIGEISSPEWVDTLSLEYPGGAVND